MNRKTLFILLGLCVLIVLLAGCAAGNEKYIEEAAGFWAGLWHGLICIVTFIISLFSDNVSIYEINNNGGWYDFGFVLGLIIVLSHGKTCCSMKCRKSDEEKEWDEIGVKVEKKVRTGIQNWLNETEEGETEAGDANKKEWEEIGKKVEEKIKRELRNWAEK